MKVKQAIYTVDVPVKPHVKAYLETEYGGHPEPNRFSDSKVEGRNDHQLVTLPQDCHLLHILRGLLIRPLKKDDNVGEIKFSETVRISISQHEFRNNGFTLSKHGQALFNKLVDTLMKERIADKIEANIDRGMNIKSAIILAIEKLKLPEDIVNYETIKQYYYRRRDRTLNVK